MRTFFSRIALFLQEPRRRRWAAGVLLWAGIGSGAQAQQWEALPWTNPNQLNAGVRPGGEGGQWPQAVASDGTDGKFLLFGTDVGGIWRSLNGGAKWEPCNVGYTPRGNAGFAIDPNNAKYALAVGANSSAWNWHGVYLTSNKAASWRSVLPQNYTGYRWFVDGITYDRSSLSGGRSQVAYYSSPAGGLFKSTNGGENWSQINADLGYSHVKTHPTNGTVYIGNSTGFYRSTNGGGQFTRTFTGNVQSIDVSPNAPNVVWMSLETGLYKSVDSGQSFAKITTNGLPTNTLRWVKVSPANAQRIIIWWQNPSNEYDRVRYRSLDGGLNWTAATIDNSLATLPFNSRQVVSAWHPANDNIITSVGGDWITQSTDAGATYRWASNGQTAVFVGGLFNFNQQDANKLLLVTQDYNGAFTTDGGSTWNYRDISGRGWGGFCYGGYMASSSVLYYGDTECWDCPRTLRISRDGGTTWTNTGIILGDRRNKPNVSFGDPTDTNVLFAFDHRSADGGLTWTKMTGCDAVFTASAGTGRALYGRNGKDLVRSTTKGASWQVLFTFANDIQDVAYDHVRNYVYVVEADRLHRWNGSALTTLNTPVDPDPVAYHRIRTVAVDPVDPAVVYAGTSKDIAASSVSVVRSVDAGATWTSLTPTSPLSGNTVDGGREATCIRVHPDTRYAYVATSCYGMWRIGPPGSSGTALRQPENPASTAAGLDFRYYEGSWNNLPDFGALTAVKTGTVTTPSLAPRTRDDNFGFRYTGFIQVPTDGQYTFYTTSDDGSRLYIGSQLVVDNDGLHGAQERRGFIGLKAGKHAVTVTFFEKTGGQVLDVSYAGPGLSKQAVPAAAWFRAATPAGPANGTYTLAPECTPGERLDVPNSNTTPGTPPQIWPDNGANAEKWVVEKQSSGYYRITSALDANRVLEVAGSAPAERTDIWINGWNGTDGQLWNIVPTHGDYYRLVPKSAPGLALDVEGGDPDKNTPGCNIWLWTINNLSPQNWKFIPTTVNSSRPAPASGEAAAAAPAVVYPSPAADQVTVHFALPQAAAVRLVVTDALGRAVLTRPVAGQAGANRVKLSTGQLAEGLYQVQGHVPGQSRPAFRAKLVLAR
ncbi:RICIN domain-containing protein [Hymenobacter weizhouensis]|uniref:RICIN domain-containing protein n=1 Tax=Hymenobacter sp. YIM 151500-1 TaxID=2987689 RepID=UPI002227104D|nr:RICIN domain-containing protein [Hymenobacter sp. YIM 151500-1]UYZ62500.1 RICIN domain-containing protein [Hymenobacter sp. YIM 151500-1]